MWKKVWAMVLAVIIILTAVPMSAQQVKAAATLPASGTWGTCKWTIDANGVLTIGAGTGAPAIKDWWGTYTAPWSDYNDRVTQIKTTGTVVLPACCSHLFHWLGKVTSIQTNQFDTSNVTDMHCMFSWCSDLTSLDISNFNTSNVTDMSEMFDGCSGLTSLNVSKLNTSNVTNMSYMFRDCSGLTSLDVSKFDTSNVTNMEYMFDGCSGLTSLNVSKFNTSQVTNMQAMFSDCSSLTSLDVSKFDTSKVTDMSSVFNGCSGLTSLDVSKFNTNQVTNMNGMFYKCSGLTSLNVSKLNTSNVTGMFAMFSGCSSLTSLDVSKFDTSKVTDMGYMFGDLQGSGCSSLTSLNIGNFNTNQVTDMSNMFEGCSKLNKLTFGSSFAVPSSKHDKMFPTPTTTASGKTSLGTWGLGSELANTTYTADALATYGATKVGALAGTWYAQKNPIVIVTFNSNGGSGTMATQTITKNTATALNANSFNRTGYTFTGWNTKADGTGTSYADKAKVTISSDLTLYAQWKANTYTVTRQVRYQNVDGSWGAYSNIDSKAYNYGSTVPAWNRAADTTYNAASIPAFTVTGNTTKQVSVSRKSSTNNVIQARYQNADGSYGAYSTVWSGTLYYGGSHTWSRAADATYNAASKAVAYNGGTASVDVTRRTYTLTYNGNGGSTPAAVTARYGASWGTLATPTRTGYTFQGWYTAASGGTKFTGGTCSGNQTVYAHWTPNTYTVTYNANGGSGAPNAQNFVFDSGAKLSTTVPTRAGYTFAYWDFGGMHLAPGAAIPNGWGSFTATAVWTVNNYKFDVNPQSHVTGFRLNKNGAAADNGKVIGDYYQDAHIGDKFYLYGITFANGYTFNSFDHSGSGSAANSGATTTITMGAGAQAVAINAKPITYSIGYTLNGGSASGNPTSYTIESSAITLKNPTKAGWTFTGWSGTGLSGSANKTVTIPAGSTGNRTYTAHFSKTITLTQKHGGTTTTNQSYTLHDSETSHQFTLATASTSYDGWTFLGWRDSATAGPKQYDPTGKITLTDSKTVYSTFSQVQTVTFIDYNGTTKRTRTIQGTAYGNGSAGGVGNQYPTIGAPSEGTYTGWTNRGWTTSTANNAGAQISANGGSIGSATTRTYYGLYQQGVTLSYNANGGSSTPASQSGTRTTNSANIGSVANPSFKLASAIGRTGYSFAGWSMSGVGTKAAGTSVSLGANATATAQWAGHTAKVIYNANGGSGSAAATYTYGQSGQALHSGSGFTKTGYHIDGWAEKADGAVAYSLNCGVADSWIEGHQSGITLYAHWAINTYTDHISHWTFGYNHQEGNNGDKTAFKIGDTTFNQTYGSSYTMDASRSITVPNGFVLNGSFGTSSIDGSWKNYSFGTKVTQTAGNMYFEYDYYPVTYSITYNLNGGTNSSANPSSYNVLYGVTFQNPTRTGYTFTGWTIDGKAVTGINAGANATFTSATDLYNKLAARTTGNKTVVANWSANGYTVAFNGNGNTGGSMANEGFTYDSAKALTANGFTKAHYHFTGWNTKADGSGTTYADGASVKNLATGGTVTLYAQWAIDTHTFDLQGGDIATYGTADVYINGKLVANDVADYCTAWPYGTTWEIKDIKPKTGVTYDGASSALSGTIGDGNTVINLRFHWNTYTVKFASNGGSGTTADQAFIYGTAQALRSNGFSRAGYTFAGWTGSDGKTYTNGQSVSNLTATDKGTFTMTARWTPNVYTVAFNGNGGSGTMANESMTYDTAKALTGNAFTKSGYHFTGWNTKADGSGTSYTNGASVKNLATSGTVTLYAQWKFIPVVVKVPKAVSYSNMPTGAVNVSASYDVIVDSGNSYTVTVKGTPGSLTGKSGSLNASTTSQSAPLVFDKNGTKQDTVHITGTTHTADQWTGAIQYSVSAKWNN